MLPQPAGRPSCARCAPVQRVSDGVHMAEEWLTYSALGEHLGISAEAAPQKAIRYRWRRQPANDGKAQVLVDLEEERTVTAPR